MNAILSTRCDPSILQQMKQTAKTKHCSLRELIEHMRKHYQQEQIRQQIKNSYQQMDDESIAIAEEDMHSYFKTLVNHEHL